MEHEKENIEQAFINAVAAGDIEAMRSLYRKKPNVNLQAIFDIVLENHKLEVAEFLIEELGVKAPNQMAVMAVCINGNTETLAFMLEKSADARRTPSHMISPLRRQRPEIFALIYAAYKIEDKIEEWQEQEPGIPTPALRRLFFSAAYMASTFITEPDACYQQALTFVEQGLAEIVPDPKKHAPEIELSRAERIKEAARKIGFPYHKLSDAEDVVIAYVETVLLPKYLLESGIDPETYGADKLYKIMQQLNRFAAKILYGDKSLAGVLEYSRQWHDHPLPDEMRPLRAGEWHPLMEPVTTPVTAMVKGEEHPVTIVPLCSSEILSAESKALHHCVGHSDYGFRCMSGDVHILSLRAGEKPLATLEVEWDGEEINVLQFRGYKNNSPPPEAQQAWAWFEEELADGHIKLNPKPKKGWGGIEEKVESNDYPPIIRQIGYVPTPEHIAACHRHYTQGFNVKEEYVARARSGQMGGPRHYHMEHRFVPPGGEDLTTALTTLGAADGNLNNLLKRTHPNLPS